MEMIFVLLIGTLHVTTKPIVKVFEEERELTMMLMVDISGRKVLALKQFKKRYCYREIATMAFLQRRIMTK
jgi:hypothetical protein